MVNHFEFHREITSKSGLLKKLKEICTENGLNLFDITPITFHINLIDKNWEMELQQFLEFFIKF